MLPAKYTNNYLDNQNVDDSDNYDGETSRGTGTNSDCL